MKNLLHKRLNGNTDGTNLRPQQRPAARKAYPEYEEKTLFSAVGVETGTAKWTNNSVSLTRREVCKKEKDTSCVPLLIELSHTSYPK